MNAKQRSAVVAKALNFYFDSGDFNGYPIFRLKTDFRLIDSQVIKILSALIADNLVEVVFGNMHPNSHIKAFGDISPERQLEFLAEGHLNDHACVYPSRLVLKDCPLIHRFDGMPYSKALALGCGQLNFRAFDLAVLEHYRNDPRYIYRTDWINGFITIRDEFYNNGTVPEHDEVSLETFGFAYNENLDRAVAVFLRYLNALSPEHQRLWEAKELKGDYKLHPDYYRNSILGEFGTKISIFDAFLQEIRIINEMSVTMEKPPFFLDGFKGKSLNGFGFLVRPTEKEFNNFIHLLDKLISENINKDFFRGDIALEIDTVESLRKMLSHASILSAMGCQCPNSDFTLNPKTILDKKSTSVASIGISFNSGSKLKLKDWESEKNSCE